MRRILTFLFFIFALPGVKSQILPKEGSQLNYRIICFSFPASKNAKEYKVEVAAGNYCSEDSFQKNIVLSQTGKTNKIIAEVPAFGINYTWRAIHPGNNNTTKSALHHFRTIMNARVDTTKTRLRIMQPAETRKDDYIAVEGGGIIYDMSGNPVWCVPESSGLSGDISDIKFTSQGTITFMKDQTGYEINYDGKILWQTPPHDTVSGDEGADYYHHEFTRLASGHYMILGTQFVWYKRVDTKDSSYFTITTDKSKHSKYNGGHSKYNAAAGATNRGKFGIIAEFDSSGNVVWSWKSLNYLMKSDYVNYWPKDTSLRFEPHENAFYFDEKNNAVYLSLREPSRILKIDHRSGKVLNTYGEVFKPGVPPANSGIFCSQHSIRRSEDGYLYLFNNNTCNGPNALPSIVIMHEPVSEKDSLEKLWEYSCMADGYKNGGFPSGGIGIELPDHSIFICLGSDYGKLLIVNRAKKILWSALPETYDAGKKSWSPPKKNYRANIISRQLLESMIRKAEM